MRTTLWMVGVMALGLTGTAHAQERAMVTTSVGIATTSEATSGAIDLGSGVSLNRRLTVFGGIGRVMNVAPALAQPAVNAAGMTRVGGGVQIPIHK
jgi:hypothetical protein